MEFEYGQVMYNNLLMMVPAMLVQPKDMSPYAPMVSTVEEHVDTPTPKSFSRFLNMITTLLLLEQNKS